MAKVQLPKHMALNRRTYLVRLRVPRDLAGLPQFKSGFVQEYLGTDFGEAKRQMHAALARLQERFQRAREGSQVTPGELANAAAIEMNRIDASLRLDPLNAPAALDAHLDAIMTLDGEDIDTHDPVLRARATAALERLGVPATENSIEKMARAIGDAGYEMAVRWQRHLPAPAIPSVSRRPAAPLGPLAQCCDDWLASLGIKHKTKAKRAATVRLFCETFPTPADVSRPKVKEWLNKLARDRAPGTVRRMLSEVRLYWEHLYDLQIVAEEQRPFDGVKVPRNGTKRDNGTTAKPFDDPRDAVRILDAAKGDAPLAALILISMYSGARPDEVCSLRVSDVDLGAGCFTIRDSKTDAATRIVPIHSKLLPLLTELASPKHDFIIEGKGIKADADGDRYHNLGQRGLRLIRKLDRFGPEHKMYSFRKTVVTQLEQANIPENVAADILGHEKPRITYGLYSGGTSMAQKREAIEKLAYPGL